MSAAAPAPPNPMPGAAAVIDGKRSPCEPPINGRHHRGNLIAPYLSLLTVACGADAPDTFMEHTMLLPQLP